MTDDCGLTDEELERLASQAIGPEFEGVSGLPPAIVLFLAKAEEKELERRNLREIRSLMGAERMKEHRRRKIEANPKAAEERLAMRLLRAEIAAERRAGSGPAARRLRYRANSQAWREYQKRWHRKKRELWKERKRDALARHEELMREIKRPGWKPRKLKIVGEDAFLVDRDKGEEYTTLSGDELRAALEGDSR